MLTGVYEKRQIFSSRLGNMAAGTVLLIIGIALLILGIILAIAGGVAYGNATKKGTYMASKDWWMLTILIVGVILFLVGIGLAGFGGYKRSQEGKLKVKEY